jgi:Iap family predicted aminopeptidase
MAEPAALFDPERVLDVIGKLSEDIGPREATSERYRRAGEFIHELLRMNGYTVRRQSFPVPAGTSWGVSVPAGETFNVIAERPGFDSGKPHLIVGAHLDTVPQAPGANDNGSGIGVMIELARLAALEPPEVQIMFVAFGAEEPRRPGDDGHHYGSRTYVRAMSAATRRALLGIVSLDRVGTGTTVQVCHGRSLSLALAERILANASALAVSAERCSNRTSDHWPFERVGLTGVRLGGIHTAEYHSPRDRLEVIDRAQIARTGLVMWETIRRFTD